MHIQLLIKSNAYRILWLKYVTGFDVSKHCARCLIGKYSKLLPYGFGRNIAGTVYEGELNEHEAPYLYLCGVTSRYACNLHVAFSHCPGEVVSFEDDNIRLTIHDAVQYQIREIPGLVMPREFTSCRNYQFGYAYIYQKEMSDHVPGG